MQVPRYFRNAPFGDKTDVHNLEAPSRQYSGQSEELLPSGSPSSHKEVNYAYTPATGTDIPALALIGNPGAGKSTILNGITGRAVFASGISLGSGMTTSLMEYHHNGMSLFDTPGLADIVHKKAAGRELETMLSKKFPLRIAFVVTLERGRVRPEDALTVDLVLDSITSERNDRFGMIINRVSDRVRAKIEGCHETEAKIRCSLTGRYRTSHWCYVSIVDRLEDKNDGALMTDDLASFSRCYR